MNRGKPDQSVFTFELPNKGTMPYPDAELWTRNYVEARSFAEKRGYLLIENTYEWADSELVQDYSGGKS